MSENRTAMQYVLNFGHPLHPGVVAALCPATEVRVPLSLVLDADVPGQIARAVDTMAAEAAKKGGKVDGTSPVLVALPGLTEGAAALLAELHGRLGTFPRVLQLRRREDGTFGLAAVLDLEKLRLAARGRR